MPGVHQPTVAAENANHSVCHEGWEGNWADVLPVGSGGKDEDLGTFASSRSSLDLSFQFSIVFSLETGRDADDIDIVVDGPLNGLA